MVKQALWEAFAHPSLQCMDVFNESYHKYSLPDPHDADNILKVVDSKVKVTDNYSGRGKPVDSLMSKTIWID